MERAIYLNSQLIDINPEAITFKKQIADFKDISVFKSSFSYTTTIPPTSRNKTILNMLGVTGGTSAKPYEIVRCDYYLGNIAIIRNGRSIVKKANNGYELNLVDGVFSLAETLGTSSITDLDLTGLNHQLTPQVVIDSWENAGGYIYALGDFGLGYTDLIDIKTIAPSIYLHTLIDFIFSQNGLIKEGDFFTTNTEYLNEILTPTTGYLVDPESYEFTDKGTAESDTVSETDTDTSPISSELDFVLTDIDLAVADLEISSDNILINTAGFYRFGVSFNKTTTTTLNYIKAYINGVLSSTNEVVNASGDFTIELGCEVGDVIKFAVLAESSEATPPYTIDYSINFDLTAALLTSSRLVEGSEFAPNIKQADLIKDTAQRYGLLIETYINDSEQVVYKFKQLDEVLSDKAGAIDYSDKVVSIGSESYQVEYAQENSAKYKYRSDGHTLSGFDGEILINNHNLQLTTDLFTSIFEIPDFTSLDEGQSVYKIPILSIDEEVIAAETTPAKVVTTETMIRDLTLVISGITGQKVSSGIYIDLANISMQHKLDTNYPKFTELNNNYNEQEVVLKLSPIDLYNFRFFRLIYLKQKQAYYYCDTNSSNSNGNSTLTLIKVY